MSEVEAQTRVKDMGNDSICCFMHEFDLNCLKFNSGLN